MKYTLVRTVKPTDDIVTLAEARAQLRVDTYGSPPASAEDGKISQFVTAITESLDAGTGWLGRALASQTWRLSLQRFPSPTKSIPLPYPPLIEVVSFTYTDTDGVVQTMTAGTDFRVIETEQGSFVTPPWQDTWPSNVRDDFDSIQITFRCGYVAGSPEAVDVPEQIKNYVLASLTEQFDSRGVNPTNGASSITTSIENSLNSLRVYWP